MRCRFWTRNGPLRPRSHLDGISVLRRDAFRSFLPWLPFHRLAARTFRCSVGRPRPRRFGLASGAPLALIFFWFRFECYRQRLQPLSGESGGHLRLGRNPRPHFPPPPARPATLPIPPPNPPLSYLPP